MKKAIMALLLLFAATSAFATQCVPGAAIVHILREKAYTGSRISRSVYFDNTLLAKISNGSYFHACLPQGAHHIKVDDNPHGDLELSLDAGKEYFLQVQLPLAMWKAHWEIVQIEDPLATSIMRTLEPLNYNKIKAPAYASATTFVPYQAIPTETHAQDQRAATSDEKASSLYDIKGDRLGMSLEDFKSKYRKSSSSPACFQGREVAELFLSAADAAAGVAVCYPGPASDVSWLLDGSKDAFMKSRLNEFEHPGTLPRDVTIANVQLIGLAFHFYKGQLFKIIAVFPSDGYDTMKAAFTEKFGTPSVTPRELQNAYGAKFDGEQSNWTNGVSAIQMKRRTSDVSKGGMVMILPDVQKQVEEATPKKPKDL